MVKTVEKKNSIATYLKTTGWKLEIARKDNKTSYNKRHFHITLNNNKGTISLRIPNKHSEKATKGGSKITYTQVFSNLKVSKPADFKVILKAYGAIKS